MRYSKILFLLFTCLGVAILTLMIVSLYLRWVDSLSILATLDLDQLGIPLLTSAGTFLTIGILGLDWKNVKKYRKRFVVLYVVLIPITIIFCFFVISFFAVFYFAPMFPIRSEITKISINKTNPLVLCFNIRALTVRDSRIEGVVILENNTMVASRFSEPLIVNGVWTLPALCELPGASEIIFTIDFNTTLSSGIYDVRLTSAHNNHGSASFAIP